MGATVAFWVLAITAGVSAFMVVSLRNLFRAAMFLVISFLAVAGIFILLQADFLAAVQILLYAGAIAILLVFAIMLTRDVPRGSPENRLRYPAFVLSALLLAALVFVAVDTPWPTSGQPLPPEQTVDTIADALFNKFALPFEIASVLLLAAMIGAIVLARGREE